MIRKRGLGANSTTGETVWVFLLMTEKEDYFHLIQKSRKTGRKQSKDTAKHFHAPSL